MEADHQTDNIVDLSAARDRIAALSGMDAITYGQRRKAAARELGIAVSILDKEVQKRRRIPADASTKNLILSDRGAVLPILANAIEILKQGHAEWAIGFEEFSQRPYVKGRPMEHSDLLDIAEWIQRQGCHAGRAVTDDAIMQTAHRNRFHVVKTWLESLQWDGAERLDMMMIDHAGVEDTPLARAFTAKFMIQSVARIYLPGCQADATLVLEGPQGIGKSSLLRTLFGDDWFTDHLPNLDNKDAQIQLLGVWCVELAELAAINGKEAAKIKQFLTSPDDRFRLPFEKIAKSHPRQCVFAGTVNPGADGYLKDETGARRFWPLVLSHVDTGAIDAMRTQLWAEAVHRFRMDEKWHLGAGDLHDDAQAAQADRFVTDPWLEPVADYIAGRDFVKLADIYRNAVEIAAVADWNQLTQNRLARCLTHLGWEKKQRRVASTTNPGSRERGYSPVTGSANDPEPVPEWEDRSETLF